MTVLPDNYEKNLTKNMLFAESMSKHTTFKIGGDAESFVKASSPGEVIHWTKYAKEKNMPLSVIGNGSNLLVSDDGVKGLVLQILSAENKPLLEGENITVFGGYPMGKLINQVNQQGLAGLEKLAGIPGTVGGAVFMNAGARGAEISDCIQWVKVLDLKKLETTTLSKKDIAFSYRYSSLQNNDTIILEVKLKLKKTDPNLIKATVTEILKQRKLSQPINFPNSGSIFKNPPNSSAGRLIEEVGLKGYRIGDAQIAQKHANFIINLGCAKAWQVMELMNIAKKEVFSKFHIKLVPEIRILGGGLKLEEV